MLNCLSSCQVKYAQLPLPSSLRGMSLLRTALLNKGTAFSREERIALGLDGLLPPHITTLEEQLTCAYRRFQEAPTQLDKYVYVRALQDTNETLFYALVERHLTEIFPILYTPTVGQAAERFHLLFQNPRGLSFAPDNIERAEEAMSHFSDVRMIVATDSSAVLGIGDQGYGGLAIAIGKLSLYTVGGGVSPFHTMPVVLDVGTNRVSLREDPLYLGVHAPRKQGAEYLAFMDRFVQAVQQRYPKAVLQWEDLAKETAFDVLERYRHTLPSFNDDIQGTGAMALAGVLRVCALHALSLRDQRIVIYGAGAGGIGVAAALLQGCIREGLSREEAKQRIFVLDSKGLLVQTRRMESYKKAFAQDPACLESWHCQTDTPTLLETIQNAEATMLLGLSGQPNAFTQHVVEALLRNTLHPVVFPLSNPNSACEVTPEDLLRWTNGQALVATGSPFSDVSYKGRTYSIAQGNNALIFPGLGFGAIVSEAREITDNMVLAAAYALAEYTSLHIKERELIYPPVEALQEVSIHVACRVIEQAVAEGASTMPFVSTEHLAAQLRARRWKAEYLPIIPLQGSEPSCCRNVSHMKEPLSMRDSKGSWLVLCRWIACSFLCFFSACLPHLRIGSPDMQATSKPSVQKKKLSHARVRRGKGHVVFPPRGDMLPASRYARMDSETCKSEIARRGISWSPIDSTKGVRDPGRLTGPLHGVSFQGNKPPLDIIDCRLVLALDDLSIILVEHRIEQVKYMSAYRPPGKGWQPGKGSWHHRALAIDVKGFVGKDKTKWSVLKDWHKDMIQKLVRALYEKAPFHQCLTRRYNAAHRDHFHLGINPNLYGTQDPVWVLMRCKLVFIARIVRSCQLLDSERALFSCSKCCTGEHFYAVYD